ncbi:MAG: Rpn family recombination-promoting nuclease/putative transposase, partial [Spirochaetes bacterium]|nr:Rpn family recombination-promoting nuclease/putative transposase [Spirochaetota bacterium]
MPIKHIHDNAYKYIFSNKRIFYQLIKSFVKEDFVRDLDLKNIDLLDKSFISDEFLARESDVMYRIKLKNKIAYIYILLEFQSTVDKSIPVRMPLYLLQ